MNIWQDGTVSEATTPSTTAIGPGEEVRSISTVETLRALADPTRLSLLGALMTGPAKAMPVMSVKELAAKLDEPQTKLYRHIKQLEAAGLIRVAASRVVSGIVEQRYQACQRDLMFGPGLTEEERGGATMEAAVAAAFELYRSRLFAAQRAGLIAPPGGDGRQAESHRRVILSISETHIPVARAAEIRERLERIHEDLGRYAEEKVPEGAGGEPATISVHVLLGYFSPDSPAD